MSKDSFKSNTSNDERVELHLHTTFSAMDALTNVDDAVKRAGEYGQSAVAITDYGSVQAFPKAYRASKKYGVKVIYGIECDCIDDSIQADNAQKFRVVLLVKNKTGRRNLYGLFSCYEDGELCVPQSVLRSHREGLLIGTVGNKGELYKAILDQRNGNTISQGEMFRIAEFYDYIEVQPCLDIITVDGYELECKAQEELNVQMAHWSDAAGKPLVAVGNVHFLDAEDEISEKALLWAKGIATNGKNLPLYFKTTEEMLNEFAYLGEITAYEAVVENTRGIADSVDDRISPTSDSVVCYPSDKGSQEDIENKCRIRAEAIYGNPLPGIVKDRLDWEMDAINKHGFHAIYSIMEKLVARSEESGFAVGSRGCAAASFVTFLLGITAINPLPPHYLCDKCKHCEFDLNADFDNGIDLIDKVCPICGAQMSKSGFNLAVETILGRDGDMVPDIDINVACEYQPEAFRHLEEICGKNRVFRAGTVSTISERLAYGYAQSYSEKNRLDLAEDELAAISQRLTGVKRSDGEHPGGYFVVPSDMDITDFTPVHKCNDSCITHFPSFEMNRHLLKLDILGLEACSLLSKLHQSTGVAPASIALDDRKTLQSLTDADTIGVPEFQSIYMRSLIKAARPETLSDLIRVYGLSHGTDTWENNAERLIASGIAGIRDVISTRDDIMQYLMRKGMGRAKAYKYMEIIRKGRIACGTYDGDWETDFRQAGVDEWYIESAGKIKYLFPKAHATAYAIQSYQIAWYKVHYPIYFYAALLNCLDEDRLFTASDFEKSPDDLRKELDGLISNESGDYHWDDDFHDRRIQAVELLIDYLDHGYTYVPFNEKERKDTSERFIPGSHSSIRVSDELLGE